MKMKEKNLKYIFTLFLWKNTLRKQQIVINNTLKIELKLNY